MEESSIIKQLMSQSNNKTKSEKYQQDKVMITQMVAYLVLPISTKNAD